MLSAALAKQTSASFLCRCNGEQPKNPILASSIAGVVVGLSTLCTYLLELLKTRLIVQRGVYKNFLAFVTIVREESRAELYRGLTPSLIGVIPYAAINYLACDALRKAFGKAMSVLIGCPKLELIQWKT